MYRENNNFDFSKPADRARFKKLPEEQQNIEVFEAQEKAELIRQWMALDKVEPHSETARRYIGKLQKLRALYPHQTLAGIAARIGLDEITESQYANEQALSEIFYGSEEDSLSYDDLDMSKILTRTREKYALKAEDEPGFMKKFLALSLKEGRWREAAFLAENYFRDGELGQRISQYQDDESQKIQERVAQDKETTKEIYKALYPVLTFEVAVIEELKFRVQEHPGISRDNLQKVLLSRLESWEQKPPIYERMLQDFSSRIDRYELRRKQIQHFRELYEKDVAVVNRVLKFQPKSPAEVIFSSPWSISIILQPDDFEQARKVHHYDTIAGGWHQLKSPYNFVQKSSRRWRHIMEHEDTHAFEEIIKIQPALSNPVFFGLQDTLRRQAPWQAVKSQFQNFTRAILDALKEEILNHFHDEEIQDPNSKENRLLTAIFEEHQIRNAQPRQVRNVQHVIKHTYLPFYRGKFEELAKLPKSYPEIAVHVRKSASAVEKMVSGAIADYGKILFDAKGKLRFGDEDEEKIFILANLLPLHQYYRLSGIVQRWQKDGFLESQSES